MQLNRSRKSRRQKHNTIRVGSFISEYPVVLSIAGSDNSGGAGIQADIKTCQVYGTFCTTAITAITAQNSKGLRMADYVGDSMLESQLDSIFECFSPDAVKIGMVPSASAVEIISRILRQHNARNIVIDTVLSATAGGCFNRDGTVKAMTTLLFPMATLITPNLPELHILSGKSDLNPADAATRMIKFSEVRNVLIKGGHSEGDTCNDLLVMKDGRILEFNRKRINSPDTHGTGCTLSSAIACGLALGMTLECAIEKAKTFITDAIARGHRFRVTELYGPVHQSDLRRKR